MYNDYGFPFDNYGVIGMWFFIICLIGVKGTESLSSLSYLIGELGVTLSHGSMRSYKTGSLIWTDDDGFFHLSSFNNFLFKSFDAVRPLSISLFFRIGDTLISSFCYLECLLFYVELKFKESYLILLEFLV